MHKPFVVYDGRVRVREKLVVCGNEWFHSVIQALVVQRPIGDHVDCPVYGDAALARLFREISAVDHASLT